MDLIGLFGLILGIGAVLGTQLIEGGHPAALAQGPAAIIVFVGTLGATIVSASRRELGSAIRELRLSFQTRRDLRPILPARYRDLGFIARKDGLISLEMAKGALPSPFMRRAVRHVIDGCEAHELRDILDADARARSDLTLAGAQVFEVAGGYAPTMGILGAVLGLIQAMESLSDPSALGAGIAIAFVATIYGVGLANLVLLPIATRIRSRADRQRAEDDMVIEGTLALQSGMSPRTLERVLEAHLADERP